MATPPTARTARHPVQTPRHYRGQAWVPTAVTMAAYEVYCHVYGPQEAMIKDHCRGGFSSGELIAFLYARAFQKKDWRHRVDEAFEGMNI